METLQFVPSRVVRSFNLSQNVSLISFSGVRQVGFASSLLSRNRTVQSCCVRARSYAEDRSEEDFIRTNSGGAQDKEQNEGRLLGAERDSTGSVVGFQLIPHSGNVASSGGELSDDSESSKEEPTATTYSIVFVTAEAAPYSKTGGLGDVCGSLPIALAARGHRVMVVSPRYINESSLAKFDNAVELEQRAQIYCFDGVQEVGYFHEYRGGVDWIFVDHPSYHRAGTPYGDSNGTFGDNQFRFTLLCHAACEAPLVLPLGGFTYGENCLFLANDWHAGLVPVLLSAKYRPHSVYLNARSIFVIHNLAHQGVEPASTYKNLGLPNGWYKVLEWVFPPWARTHALDPGEAVNVLKAAIVTADRIVTVSPGYSWEITTPEGGCGLHELLTIRQMILTGITNGIDAAEWNPSTDKYLPVRYSIDNLGPKAQCKIKLQQQLGLPILPDCPLIGFIGRLDYQKGVDILLSAIPELLQDTVQVVMLGSGEKQYEDWMRHLESVYRDKYRGWVGFNIPISHRITAGCDILVMPSRFEPCGLNQLYAMRYGTVPVVHKTGGLRDTVKNFNPFPPGGGPEQGTGWTFSPLSKECLLATLRIAIATYNAYKSSWEGLMRRGMERDSTWDNAAAQYEQVFEWAFKDPPYPG
ncbi:soluble starch synthase 1, chloroplastic/amyloplastic isoform X2 [Andrographis paniculata]|uniref:soluble starch synthase 1, chloroplastic/amyloplastic isoform X2 n=1 Tax=Andrographis paniculata TaxID=175694 RepID=UPI0021E88F60|nr:soluble starch synthase 1, chloroplastic/amyloplastic isoform X2 [Andrographis paniculata]